jgi:hypothetical protein
MELSGHVMYRGYNHRYALDKRLGVPQADVDAAARKLKKKSTNVVWSLTT